MWELVVRAGGPVGVEIATGTAEMGVVVDGELEIFSLLTEID